VGFKDEPETNIEHRTPCIQPKKLDLNFVFELVFVFDFCI